jgi:hypothetical protein
VFSRDGTTHYSGADDGTVRVWSGALAQNLDEVKAEACALVGGSLTREQWQDYVPGIPYRKTC